jgi:hypothetical protein
MPAFARVLQWMALLVLLHSKDYLMILVSLVLISFRSCLFDL